MSLYKSALLLIGSLALCLTLISCGKTTLPPKVQPLLITTTTPLTNGVINATYSITFAAKGGVPPYSWSLISGSLPDGLALDASGVLSGTPTKLQTSTFKVQVTDSQTPTAAIQSGSFSLTINDVLKVTTTTLTAGTVNIPYGASLQASGGVPPYSWTITSGSLPAGLTLASNGSITGTPTVAGTSTFTVQVSDSETTPVTATGNVSLTINGPNGRLNGNYAFSFRGFNQGNLVLYAGSFISDGNGNITSGVLDYNTTTGPLTSIALTGTYSLDDNGHGTMSLNAGALGTLSYQVVVSTFGYIDFIQNGNATDTATRGAGTASKQTTSAFNLKSLAANWSFGGVGTDSSGGRYGAVGYFVLNDKGTVTSGLQDSNDAGSLAAKQSITGSIATPDSTTGRATGTLGTASAPFVYYIVNTNQMIALSTQTLNAQNPLLQLSVMRQQVATQGFSSGYLNGSALLEFSGVGTVNQTAAPDVILGQLNFDGKGGFTGSDDENLGGTLTQNTVSAGTYSVDATSGRTTTTGIGTTPPVMYLTSIDTAFVLGNDASVEFGTLQQQYSGTQQFSNASFQGSYAGGSVLPVLPSVTVNVDWGSADGASPTGTLSLNYDSSGPTGPIEGQTLTGTYVIDASTGRFPLMVNGSTAAIGYVINPGTVALLSVDANPKIDVMQK